MKVILVSGIAQSGKDTFASILNEELNKQNKKVLILHFADSLKMFCKTYLKWDGNKLSADGRKLLQWFGTDVVRKNYEDTWVDIIIALLKGIHTLYDYVIIPDVRFPNEIYKMDDNFNCITVKINRPHFDNGLTELQRNHPSETLLSDFPMEFEVINDKTLVELRESACTFLKNINN